MNRLASGLLMLLANSMSTDHGSVQTPPAIECAAPESDLIALARVTEAEVRSSLDDPEGVTGWIYYLDILDTQNSPMRLKRAAVFSDNTTARVLLDVGKTYVLFASLNTWGVLELEDLTKEIDESSAPTWASDPLIQCAMDSTSNHNTPGERSAIAELQGNDGAATPSAAASSLCTPARRSGRPTAS